MEKASESSFLFVFQCQMFPCNKLSNFDKSQQGWALSYENFEMQGFLIWYLRWVMVHVIHVNLVLMERN